jgi:hypothetical protein
MEQAYSCRVPASEAEFALPTPEHGAKNPSNSFETNTQDQSQSRQMVRLFSAVIP